MMYCKACNAKLEDREDVCPACGAPVDSTPPPQVPAETASDNPYQSPIDVPVQTIPAKISIPLAIGLLVILAGSFFISLGLGIGLTLLAVPAYARAAGRSLQRYSRGEVITTDQRILSFVGSVLVVGICAIAGGIAFFVTCLGAAGLLNFNPLGGGDGTSAIILISLCGLGFLTAAGVVYWMCWPRARR